MQRPRAQDVATERSGSQTMKGFTSQARELGLSPGTVGWLQEVNRGFPCFRKITLAVGRSGIGGGALEAGRPPSQGGCGQEKGNWWS